MTQSTVRVAPTDIPEDHNTVRDPLEPVAIWELSDAHFAFDSSILLPSMALELSELVTMVRTHPDAPLSVFGHADPTGEEGYNKLLSGRRAIAVYGFLTRRVDLWDYLNTHPMGRDDWKKADRAATIMRDHLEQSGAGVPPGTAGAALFKRYMDALGVDEDGAPFTVLPEAFLGRGADKGGKADRQGCGEFNARIQFSKAETRAFADPNAETERNEANAPNRRVAVMAFVKGTEVTPDKWPCPRATEGVSGCTKRLWSDAVKRATPTELRREHPRDKDTFQCRFYDRLIEGMFRRLAERQIALRLLDDRGEPFKEKPVTLTVMGNPLQRDTDAEGKVSFRVPLEAESAVLEFEGHRSTLTIEAIPDVTTVPGLQRRLANLGYYGGAIDGLAGPRTRDAIMTFQQWANEKGRRVPVNGNPDDRRTQRALVAEHGS